MSRAIKFRAWCEKDGHTPFQIYVAPDHHTMAEFWRIVALYESQGWKVAVREFTGLHDKNGKEAWEGDLIEYWHEDDLTTMEICFEKGCFVADGVPLCDIGDFEVKGNIWGS